MKLIIYLLSQWTKSNLGRSNKKNAKFRSKITITRLIVILRAMRQKISQDQQNPGKHSFKRLHHHVLAFIQYKNTMFTFSLLQIHHHKK